jgi:hypothetical protein
MTDAPEMRIVARVLSRRAAACMRWHPFALNRGEFMRDEAVITINGARLTDAESMTVRVAIDALANVLAEGLGHKKDKGMPLTDRYMESLSRIQTLLENPEKRRQ